MKLKSVADYLYPCPLMFTMFPSGDSFFQQDNAALIMCWWYKISSWNIHPISRCFTCSNDPKGFYQSLKPVWGSRVNYPKQLIALNNKTIIIEKHKLLVCWKDCFATLLNEPSLLEQHAVDNIEQKPTQNILFPDDNVFIPHIY